MASPPQVRKLRMLYELANSDMLRQGSFAQVYVAVYWHTSSSVSGMSNKDKSVLFFRGTKTTASWSLKPVEAAFTVYNPGSTTNSNFHSNQLFAVP